MWSILNFELRGKGHIKENVPCQDKTFSLYANGVTVCALSDGAGSALFSHYGAETAVRSICLFLTEHFDNVYNANGKNAKSMILDILLSNLDEKAKEINCKLKDLAATLLVVAVNGDNCVVIHIGDGIIGCLRNGGLEIISFPNNGEFANSTYFITTDNTIHHITIKKGNVNNISGFALMSDGTAESMYSKKDKSLIPAIKKIMQTSVLFNDEAALAFIKKGFDLVVENTTDDCSLGIIARHDEYLSLYDGLTASEKIDLFGLNGSKREIKKRLKIIDRAIALIVSGIQDKELLYMKLKYRPKHIDYIIIRPLIEEGVLLCINNNLHLNLRLKG
jgi:serine/threonine protein phosphatase PrpC